MEIIMAKSSYHLYTNLATTCFYLSFIENCCCSFVFKAIRRSNSALFPFCHTLWPLILLWMRFCLLFFSFKNKSHCSTQTVEAEAKQSWIVDLIVHNLNNKNFSLSFDSNMLVKFVIFIYAVASIAGNIYKFNCFFN